MVGLSESSARPSAPSGRAARALRARPYLGGAGVAAVAVAILLALVLPLFFCMPLWCDVYYFDLCTRALLRGEVLYREMFPHNLPGRMLLQAGLRAVIGWRSEPLRVVDFLVVGGIVALLVRRFLPPGTSAAGRWWLAGTLFLFYFSTTEWCHGQPDVWMLLPALGALVLRDRQTDQLLAEQPQGAKLVARGVAEGVLWGVAFLIKPFVVFPALACCLLTPLLAWRKRRGSRRLLAADAGAVLAGGFLVGAGTFAWLWLSGNWPYLLDAYFGQWNREYYQASARWAQRWERARTRLWPWCFVHAVAVPVATGTLAWGLRRLACSEPGPAVAGRSLFAAFYLGWLVEAHLVQRQFDYHLVPPVLLGVTLVAGQRWLFAPRVARAVVAPALLAWAVLAHPLLAPGRLALWPRCWREGSSPGLRDRLTLDPQFIAPGWAELEDVAEFLGRRGVGDREVTCFSLSTVSLYERLHIRPPTRFVLLWSALYFYQGRRPEIVRELEASPERYIVSDLRELFWEKDHPPAGAPPGLPETSAWAEKYPVVLRTGRYEVRQVPTAYARK